MPPNLLEHTTALELTPFIEATTPDETDHLLAALYDRHAPGIYRFCLGMLGRREDAEDAVQTVWLKLATRPDRITTANDPPAYLWAVARHHVRSRLRRRALERLWTPPLDEADDDLPTAPGSAVPDDERRDLVRAVRRLRPRLRAVVVLVGFAGLTLEEAAWRLGIPRGTAASRYHAAIQRLQHLLRAR